MSIVCPLCSGSEGNSIYIKIENDSFLVDVGRSCRQIENLMSENGINPHEIKSIFVTHEHGDHVKGLNVFARRYNKPVYGSEGTIRALEEKKILNNVRYKSIDLSGIDIGDVSAAPFDISHDCIQGFGYSFYGKNKKVSVCSDIGIVTPSIFDSIIGSDVVILESNHDIDMLESGPYPIFLKQRILSDKGHLSNVACAQLIHKLAKTGTKKFVLCHLSSNNNDPKIAYDFAFSAIESAGVSNFELYVAPKINMEKIIVEF